MNELCGCRVRIHGITWQSKNHPATWYLVGKIGTVIDCIFCKGEEFLIVEVFDLQFLLKEGEIDIAGPDEIDEESPVMDFPIWKNNSIKPFDLLVMRKLVFYNKDV